MSWRSFIAGCVVGGVAVGCALVLNNTFKTFDAGVSLTYANADNVDLRAESDVLLAMAEPHWLGLPAHEAKERLIGMGVFDFEKGSEGFAAGPVFLRVQDDRVVEIQAHCARTACKDQGVN